ncbi:MAG: hypothetical protein WBR15_02340 [Gammaproteobacteria bacterium]
MTQQLFRHRGFTIKVITHELFSSNSFSNNHLGWHACSIVISRDMEGEHHYHEESLHPGRISVTPERAVEYGRKYALRIIDEEILYANLSKFLSARPI